MRFFRKTAISLMIAASLSACSDNKNETADTKKEGQSVVSAPQLKSSKAFEEMLSHVPANTSYLITNSRPIPEKIIAAHMKRAQSIMSKMTAQFKKISTSNDESGEAKADAEIGDFFTALMIEYGDNLSIDGLKKLGFKLDGHSALYEIDMMPVMRMDLTSKDAVKALLTRVEEKSGYKLEWSKCGEHDCITQVDEDAGFAAVLAGDQLVISAFTADKKQQILDHLMNVKKPENTYKSSDWTAFISENKYNGYSDGFIKLDALVNNAEAFTLELAKKEQGDNFDAEEFKGCFAVAKAHTANMPELAFGTKQFDENTVQYEVLVKTSPLVSKVLQGLPNKLIGMQEPENPIMSFGMNLNMPNLRGAITQYINFLAESGEANKCEAINPADLRKAVGGISMAMSMGASQFKSVYFALDELDFDAEGKPSTIKAFGTVVADDPMALLQMLAMVNPTFATLQLPNDGTPVKLPEGVIPPGPISPEVSLSRKDQSLNIFVGDDKLALKPMTLDDSTFMWGVTDSKRYYGLMNKAMEQMPNAGDAETADVMGILNAVGELSGTVSQKIGADSRGLVIDYTINY